MTNTYQLEDDSNETFQYARMAIEQENVDPGIIPGHLSYILLTLKKQLMSVIESWRSTDTFELDEKARNELYQVKQCGLDMRRMVSRALDQLDGSPTQMTQQLGEFRMQLSDMAHDAPYNPVVAYSELLLQSTKAGWGDSEIKMLLQDLINHADWVASYVDSRFPSAPP